MSDTTSLLAIRLQRAPHTTFEIVEDQAVIINLDTGVYLSLNETGTVVWNNLDGQRALSDIVLLLAKAYDATPEAIAADVLSLAQALQAEGMVTEG